MAARDTQYRHRLRVSKDSDRIAAVIPAGDYGVIDIEVDKLCLVHGIIDHHFLKSVLSTWKLSNAATRLHIPNSGFGSTVYL